MEQGAIRQNERTIEYKLQTHTISSSGLVGVPHEMKVKNVNEQVDQSASLAKTKAKKLTCYHEMYS